LVAISVALHPLYFGSSGCSLYLDNYKGQVIKYKELVAGGESWIPEKGNSKLWAKFQQVIQLGISYRIKTFLIFMTSTDNKNTFGIKIYGP